MRRRTLGYRNEKARCGRLRQQVDAARARYFTLAEARRFLNACDRDFRRLAQAALVTGARFGEFAALRASDFNPDSGTIHVRTSKGGKGRHIVLNEEGIALFKSLAAGKPADAIALVKNDGSVWKWPKRAPEILAIMTHEWSNAITAVCRRVILQTPSGLRRHSELGRRAAQYLSILGSPTGPD
jgi:integrase